MAERIIFARAKDEGRTGSIKAMVRWQNKYSETRSRKIRLRKFPT
jgi:hypothetical protein